MSNRTIYNWDFTRLFSLCSKEQNEFKNKLGIVLYEYLVIFFEVDSLTESLKVLNIFLWIVALTLLGLMLFGLYPDFNGNPLSRVSHILYQSSSRIIWAVALAYIIYSCQTSNGGLMTFLLFLIFLKKKK